MGYPRGGGAAWAFAERLISKPIQRYRGAVAITPTRIIGILDQALVNTSLLFSLAILSVQPKLVTAATTIFLFILRLRYDTIVF